MKSETDRRKQSRVEIPDALTYIKVENRFTSINYYGGPGKLIDLSVGGIGFETRKKLKIDDQLSVKIEIPDEEPLQLKGTVVWTTPGTWKLRKRVGVRFGLFGREKKFNSPLALETLEKLRERFERSEPAGDPSPGKIN